MLDASSTGADEAPIIKLENPTPEEVDRNISDLPWCKQDRLTWEAYATRCRNVGQEPTWPGWNEHQRFTDEERQLAHDCIEAMRDGFCVEEIGPKFVIREYGNKARVAWFNERGELVTMSFAEFRNAHIEKSIGVGHKPDGTPIWKKLAPYWLEHPLTRRYDHVDFCPGVDDDSMPEGVLNLWRGWPSGLLPGWKDTRIGLNGREPITNGLFDRAEMPTGYCDMLLDHMLNNMCGGDDEAMHYLLGWMADALWNPGPCDTAVILKGPQGSGKTFWAERFMEFFGVHALTLDDEDQVVGNFNKHLMNKSVIFADEAFFAGNAKHAAKLKTLVSRPDLFVEPKGVDGFVARKMFRLIMASNDEQVIRAEQDDRRNFVLSVDAGEHNQDRDYFAAMQKEWNEGGRRALFRWLTGAWWGRAVGNGTFRKWRRPVTAALQAQKDLSLPEPQMVIHNMLLGGEVLGSSLVNSRRDSVFVSAGALMDGCHLHAKHERALGIALKAIAGDAPKVREYLGDGRFRRQYRGYWLPSLAVCRTRWEASLGRSVIWPDDVATWGLEPEPDDAPF